MKTKHVILAVIIALCAGLLIFTFVKFVNPTGIADLFGLRQYKQVRIGAAGTQASLIYAAMDKGFFADQGLNVHLEIHVTGKSALEALNKGDIDLATAAETPIMFAAVRNEPIQIVAEIMNSDRDIAIIARKDHGVTASKDLVGKKIGIVKGTNSEFFLGIFLDSAQISRSDVTSVSLRSEDMAAALIEGRVDAVSAWSPHWHRLKKELGENNAVIFGSQGIYQAIFSLVGRREFIRGNPAALEKFIAALVKAETYIKESPSEAQSITAGQTRMDAVLLKEIWPSYNFQIRLDRNLILSLENAARFAREYGLISPSSTPDFLPFIYADGLRAIKPEAVDNF